MTETLLDFSVLAPLGFAAIGAMLVLLLEVFLSPPGAGEQPDLVLHRRIDPWRGTRTTVNAF